MMDVLQINWNQAALQDAPFREGNECYPSKKAGGLDGHIQRTDQSVSRGTSGLCDDPA